MITSILWFLQHSGKTFSSSLWSARVCTDHQNWEGVIVTKGVGKCKSNSRLLLRKCAENELLITTTVFHLPTRIKTFRKHPRSKHWHLTDYAIEQREDRQDVRVTKARCGANCWTDYTLVDRKLNMRIQPVRRLKSKKVPKIVCLQAETRQQTFINDICSRLDAREHRSEDLDENWTVFRDTIHSSAMDSLARVSRKHQD